MALDSKYVRMFNYNGLNYLFADGGTEYITQMIRYLQINIHLGLIKLQIPANILLNNNLLVNIAMFDILSEDGICNRCELSNYF